MILFIVLLLVYAAFSYFSFFILRDIVGIKRLHPFFALFYLGESFLSLFVTHPLFPWPFKLGFFVFFLLCAVGVWKKRRWGYFLGLFTNALAVLLVLAITFYATETILASCKEFGCLKIISPFLSALFTLIVVGFPTPFLLFALKGKEATPQNTP